MKKNSLSNYIANTMDTILNSDEHKSLFNKNYKKASDENMAKKCVDCEKETCCCGDGMMTDDNDARKAKKVEKSVEEVKEEKDMKKANAFNTAIDSLLVASAALDEIGLEKSSALSLKLASMIVEAKKKKDDKKPEVKKEDKAAVKAKKDMEDKNMAKTMKDKQMAKLKKDKAMAKDKAMKMLEKSKATKK